MNAGAIAAMAALAVSLLTLTVGAYSVSLARTTSDFYVASRSVGPATNAAAISGEYLSAASFLGVAGLVMARGVDMLWYPIGWTAGYLVLLLFVAAPLRRSRAYTLPDFAEFRLESRPARTTASTLGVLIAVLYLIPQFQGAGLTVRALTGAPAWIGSSAVAVVVLASVSAGGMRSITLVQAVQYWIKLAALLLPLAFLLAHRGGGLTGASSRLRGADWLEPMHGPHSLYLTYSLVVATFLGTMGLPHVVVRFYTNRDGFAARRTTVAVLGLLSLFYLLPPVYGILGRRYLPSTTATDAADTTVLDLPHILGGTTGDLLTAVLAAGAFAAFLSTSSGLVLSIAGVLGQGILGQEILGQRFGGITAFRIAAGIATVTTLAITLLSTGLAVAHTVELAFAVAASTFCPMLLLGIWWPRLSAAGAIAGMAIGGLLSTAAVVVGLSGHSWPGPGGAVFSQPALVTVPVAFAAMVVVSLLTAPPVHVARTMVRLHTPEDVSVDRGTFRPRGAD